jgi:hypothetical protein
MYGSMVIFLVLGVTASCKPFWRRIILLSLAFYYFKAGYFLCQFMFVAGALLAEISLVMNATKTGGAKPPTPYIEGQSLWKRWVLEYWPLTMAGTALFLASSPPENQTYAAYSRMIFFFFDDYITSEGGITPPL